jgi:2-C-methyl-D-erythritol 4-phosphate cytidylyltransferase
VLAALEAGAEAVVPAIASPDSLRHVDDGGGTTAAVPRESIRLVQTPQGFTVDALRRGHALATHDLATDDATLVELSGVAVVVVAGDPLAFKITTALDLALAETVLGGEVRA